MNNNALSVDSKNDFKLLFDKYFVLSVLALIIIGVLMVTSASMAVSERQYHTAFHYFYREIFYIILGFFTASIIIRIKMKFWYRISGVLMILGMLLLVLVMVPGIGHAVNGSTRWIGFGPLTLQVSEFIKLSVVMYMSAYLVRRNQEVQTKISGFINPMMLLGILAILLLLEPDFGAMVVVMITALSMMYLAGMRLRQFAVLIILVLVAFGILAISSPYRLLRITTFLNPWSHQFGSGYQLTQSLIAFGRGGIFGTGLGGSVQKLFYLPEAHTDFLFAVIAEELGLVGVLVVIGLYALLVSRALLIGRRAQLAGLHYSGYIAYGFAIWIGIQAVVNMGVNSGLLPTKGLTLPLISYGGSSMIIIFAVVSILLRIDYETRVSGRTKSRAGKKLW